MTSRRITDEYDLNGGRKAFRSMNNFNNAWDLSGPTLILKALTISDLARFTSYQDKTSSSRSRFEDEIISGLKHHLDFITNDKLLPPIG